MSSTSKMVILYLKELKTNFNQLYIESFNLHSELLKKIRSMTKINKRSWEYSTYIYLKSTFYEKKNKYRKLYKLVCDIEKIINDEIFTK